ncbi:trigger factor [Candidatus Uhrbacteria bacterium]|nr:trigger factor [Candidatus Uhrbacteria bacterium]
MQINTQTLPKNLFEISVELTPNELEAYVKKAAVKLASATDFPGFRNGTAPFDVVKTKVGEMALYQEGGALAIDDTLPKAIAQQKITYIGQPEVKVTKLAPGNPFTYTATFTLLPEVELPDLSKISVARKESQVSDAEVTKVVDDLRELRASEALTDKPAAKGDMVEVDFDVFVNKVAIEGGTGRKYPLVLGKGQMIPGFEDNLVGLKKDEAKEFSLTFPKDYPNKNLADKKADFKVKVLAVYARTLPALDAEFTKQFGEFKTVEDFLKLVRTNMETDAKRKMESQLELDTMEQVVAAAKVGDIPDSLVAGEARKMIDELHQNIEGQGLKFEDYLVKINKKPEDLLLGFTPEALKRVKFALVIRKIAEAEKIKASPEEVDLEVAAYKERFKHDPEALKATETPAARDYLANFIINRKAVEWLKGRVIK